MPKHVVAIAQDRYLCSSAPHTLMNNNANKRALNSRQIQSSEYIVAQLDIDNANLNMLAYIVPTTLKRRSYCRTATVTTTTQISVT